MTIDYIWWGLGAAAVIIVFWRFGFTGAVSATLALFGIKVIKDSYDRGRADERNEQANRVDEVRQRHDEINRKDHSPSDAYDHLRGLHKDD